MKLKQMTRRIIAVVLSISMLLTVLPTNCSIVFAESENSSKTILASLSDEISSMGEASAEAFADSTAEADGYFSSEVKFLVEHGYSFIKNGDIWEAIIN